MRHIENVIEVFPGLGVFTQARELLGGNIVITQCLPRNESKTGTAAAIQANATKQNAGTSEPRRLRKSCGYSRNVIVNKAAPQKPISVSLHDGMM